MYYRRTDSANEVYWHNPAMMLRSSDDTGAVDYDFLGVSREAVANMFSMNSYFHNYGQCDSDGPDLRQRQERRGIRTFLRGLVLKQRC